MSYHNLDAQKKATTSIEKLTIEEIKEHIKDCPYKSCSLLKAYRHPSRKLMERENKPYSKLHVDTIGPIKPTSYFGTRYMQPVTKDSLRVRHVKTSDLKKGLDKQLIHLIKTSLKALLTSTQKISTRAIRLDGGGEVLNTDMIEYALNNAITLEVTPARIPEMNGAAERTNGIIVTKTRTMLLDVKVPPSL